MIILIRPAFTAGFIHLLCIFFELFIKGIDIWKKLDKIVISTWRCRVLMNLLIIFRGDIYDNQTTCRQSIA